MRITKFVPALLGLGVTAAVLTACGDDSSFSAEPESAEPTTVTVAGAYGDIEVPSDPQRIVTDMLTVDYLTALGFDTSKIVAVFDTRWFREQEGHYLSDFFANEELVDPGNQFDANVEAVAVARPDLILLPFDQIDGAEQQDELGQIAPLLVVPTSEGREPGTRYGGDASFQDWRGTIRAYGEVLGMQDEAEAYVAETDAQLAALREEHGELIDETTASQVKSTPDYVALNVLATAKKSGALGTILMSELGFQSPPQQESIKPDEWGTLDLSAENLDVIDGDLLFLEVRDGSTDHEKGPLWPTLDVVKNDAVFVVGNHWEYGGAVAAREVIADIDEALTTLAERS